MEMIEEQQTNIPQEIITPEASEEDLPSPLGEEEDETDRTMTIDRAMYGAMYGTELNEAESEVESQAGSERSGDKYQPTQPEISDGEYNSQKKPWK